MPTIAIVFLAIITFFLYMWLKRQPKQQRKAAKMKLLIGIVIIALLFMAVTGRLHWLGVVIAGLLPFARRLLPLLRFLPLLGKLISAKRQQNPSHYSDGNRSQVSTQVLDMTLDHDSGVMYGTVKNGPLQGRELGDLDEAEFLQLLAYCRQTDANSARLLETYLDKRFGDSWRKDDQTEPSNNSQQPDTQTPLSRQDALEILGLAEGADRQQIIDAHRRLIQKVHPDRGGSDYLAAQINEAKDRLLK